MPTAPVILRAINAATPRELIVGDELATTGIVKTPREGTQHIDARGIAGDFIANARAHGGPDQALYLYSAEDAEYWSAQLGTPCPPGFFGENLTIDRWWPDVRIGDRLACGTFMLELTFPRIPCATLAARVGDPRFVKRFAQAARPGVYARVVSPGDLAAGDTLHVTPAPPDFPLATTLFRAWHDRANHRDVLRDALRAPLASRWRAAVQYVLDHPEG
ncbi:MAG TPA: MOSC domain-containing protein [Gemmatimonadaceae bacterium]|nr:MOSC domain-containing protein [Gemmatimonadaceae bacterium]